MSDTKTSETTPKPYNSQTLDDIRQKIDALDNRIHDTLMERADLVLKIGEEKRKKGIQIVPVGHVDEVLKIALVKELTAIEWTEPPEADVPPAPKADGEAGVVTH